MGSKRRNSSQGNIRKRPRTARKQTLVRVAEHKQAAVEKLHRRLEHAEARHLHRTRAALGIKSREVVARGEKKVDFEEDDEEGGWRGKYLERCARGYVALVDDLAHPLFAETRSDRQVSGVRPGAVKQRHAKRAEDVRPSTSSSLPVDERAVAEAESAPTLSLQQENLAAAARENSHFGLEAPPPELSAGEKLTPIGLFPLVGRVSAAAAPSRRAALETLLTTGLAAVSERALGMQPSVYAKWDAAGMGGARLQELERAFVASMREYMDVFLCRRLDDRQEDIVRKLYVVHCVTHVLRARARVFRNDAAVKKEPEAIDRAKDQGFSLARVLILLPMKNIAYEVVKTIVALAVELGPNVQNRERFEAEFAPEDEGEIKLEEEGDILDAGRGLAKRRRKPADHRRLFRGNTEDDFKLGISFSRKSIKLYADFNASDIIIASPLGLRRGIAEKVNGKTAHDRLSKKKEENEDTEWKTGFEAARQEPKQDDADEGFLSSVEICVVDGADVLSMQKWDTLRNAVDMVNKMPSNTMDTDFSRVRAWCLDGLMQRFRQTIMLSRYRKSEFVSLMRGCSNHVGRVQLVEPPEVLGSMVNVIVSMRQTFFKVPNVESPAFRADKRFSFFCANTLPVVRCLLDAQVLLIIPDYFDYVRVRNKLVEIADEDENFRFASMCEYSKGSDISRARGKLHDRSAGLVVMTERFHFFWRHWLRGADTVVWYGLPENEHYYPEIVNMTGEAADSGRQVQTFALYDEFDMFKLERVVGRKRCKKMIAKDSKSTFLFV
ncbi:unnamed protein product [Chondrus crispus]|uniref:U3 small nucleolar RNA-associated protein 25 n=1 Tax=Chondrus crispus TaxID=2769 RepID=R7QGG8_CHOCR|nr:unnamed protein product [Chondrus crispus]CDF36541.1 unnamed protein product [Chondrus crispus]|eukprot:XP_005716360.1 unnamed protein product [Chondrus crispus]